MDVNKISEQVRERARLAIEEEKIKKAERKEKDRQKEEQKKRSDYPELLRTQILAGLNVDDLGNYTDDIAELQIKLRVFIETIPDELLLKAEAKSLEVFLKTTISMFCIDPDVPAYLENAEQDKLNPYIGRF